MDTSPSASSSAPNPQTQTPEQAAPPNVADILGALGVTFPAPPAAAPPSQNPARPKSLVAPPPTAKKASEFGMLTALLSAIAIGGYLVYITAPKSSTKYSIPLPPLAVAPQSTPDSGVKNIPDVSPTPKKRPTPLVPPRTPIHAAQNWVKRREALGNEVAALLETEQWRRDKAARRSLLAKIAALKKATARTSDKDTQNFQFLSRVACDTVAAAP